MQILNFTIPLTSINILLGASCTADGLFRRRDSAEDRGHHRHSSPEQGRDLEPASESGGAHPPRGEGPSHGPHRQPQRPGRPDQLDQNKAVRQGSMLYSLFMSIIV